MSKFLIFGNGFLGNKFLNSIEDSAIVKERINKLEDIYFQIDKYNPKTIINCIGKTGRPNVDWCETHKDETFFSNVTIPALMAEAITKRNIYMVHIGSGCVFDNSGNYDMGVSFSDNDTPNYRGSYYSRSKIFSEKILSEYDNILQIRIRMPVDNIPSPRNLIDKLIGYKQVINVPNSITCIPDFLEIAKKLMDRNETGIFNLTNPGGITHEEILRMYKKIVNPSFELPEFIPVEKLNTVAGRSNCILNNNRLTSIGIYVRPVHNAVETCMKEYARHI